MQKFFQVKSTEEIFKSLESIKPLGTETVHITRALNRVLAADIVSNENVPGFQRSTVDGYALNARDTFGASEALPTPLIVVGEVKMGERPDFILNRGECCLMPTGGMLPEGADSVVMVEYSHALGDEIVEINRPVSPLENVIQPDDDIKKDKVILKKGHILRPQDLGAMASIGIIQTEVRVRPKAVIISTGEEIVYIGQKPEPGQIRDINSYTLGGMCSASGVQPIYFGIVRDKFDDLKALVDKGISKADAVLLSGGSSVGTKDLTLDVITSLKNVEILAHGVSVSPGKPTIIAKKGNKTLWGLPGHPASAMVIFDVFLRHLFGKLLGLVHTDKYSSHYTMAELDRNIESATGRDDYVRVKISQKGAKQVATPIHGKSGLITTMVEADGIVRIDRNTEGLYKGETVNVRLL